MMLEPFDRDPGGAGRLMVQDDVPAAERTCLEALRALGLASDRIFVEDFTLFTHAGVDAALARFIEQAPGRELPLVAITVVQYVRADSHAADHAATLAGLQAHADQMTRFATRYNIEVALHIHVQHFSAAAAAAMAAFIDAGALDRLGFFFDFAAADPASLTAMRQEMTQFCQAPAARNPAVRLGNFPFCLLPPEALKVIYRDAVSDLKGHIEAQRALVQEVQAESFAYHQPCGACRCRAACYVYTDIGDHPLCAPALSPRSARTLVCAGGSLSRDDAPHEDDQVWCGPAEQGDMVAAVLDGFETILLIDGYFYTKFPCTTFEVMVALEQGLNVCGTASIGALRAVELDRYGMIGVGYVYDYLKRQAIKPYHVVAQTYDAQDCALTTPLIQILYFLSCAEDAGVVSPSERCALDALAGTIHFTCLSFDAFFRRVAAAQGDGIATALRTYLATAGDDGFDIKQRDALQLLAEYKARLAARPAGAVKETMAAARRNCLAALRAKYRTSDDFTLPPAWREGAPRADVSRDRRACSAQMTCRNARAFLADLDILVADTTHYDAAGSHILSVFFVPFYFLQYAPSSATGNGEVFDEALASATMELVERLAACCHAIEGRGAGALPPSPFALDELPQSYNWGVPAVDKERAIADHGYIAVSDIVNDTCEWIPAFCVMFRYSGTDGFSSGNTLAEATLYGLYEVIERDACQIHLLDATCRALLPRLMMHPDQVTDPRCSRLLEQLDERGCDVALFALPTLCGLPCVMCQVYDRNRRIQCHGGIAVRADLDGAMHAALHEAVMQYITYFVGTRDDYHALAADKQARVAYASAQALYFSEPPAGVALPPRVDCASIEEELAHVVSRLTSHGTAHILVADLSPVAVCGVTSVKVMVPGLDLWFCPSYTPSPFLAEKARQTVAIAAQSNVL
ncbi:MAG: hypothetical protein HN919_05230 [Verrucomicrobia bacterium]|nr:hypothetical protein [Verrucomicrobiota bacterium]MBT7065683.1 hypothetical protein [Verrucomicrobiota bacterium]